MSHFDELNFTYLMRDESQFTDTLTKSTCMVAIPDGESEMTTITNRGG